MNLIPNAKIYPVCARSKKFRKRVLVKSAFSRPKLERKDQFLFLLGQNADVRYAVGKPTRIPQKFVVFYDSPNSKITLPVTSSSCLIVR